MNGQLKDEGRGGGVQLLMPVIKCKIRGDGKGGTTRPRMEKEGDKLQTWEIRFVNKERER